MTIGERVRERRRQQGLTMEQLAQRSGSTLATVSRIERGLNVPNTSTLRRLAGVLQTPVDDLLDGEAS